MTWSLFPKGEWNEISSTIGRSFIMIRSRSDGRWVPRNLVGWVQCCNQPIDEKDERRIELKPELGEVAVDQSTKGALKSPVTRKWV